jgi:hypothetical protein
MHRPVFRHLSTWIIALVALATLLIATLPELMRYGALALLEQQGKAQVSIDDIDFNPFTGEFEIERLSTSSGLLLKHAKVRLEWWPLWHRKLVVRELRGDTLKLTLVRHADGSLVIGGIAIPAGNATPKAAQNHEASTPWQINLPGADFTHLDLTVELDSGAKQPPRHAHLTLNDLYLYRLAIHGQQIRVGELRLDGFAAEDSAGQLSESLQRLQLYGLQLDATPHLALDEANILKLVLAPPAPFAGGSFGRITLRQLQAAPAGPFSLASLHIDDAILPSRKSTRLGGFASLQLDDLKGVIPERLSLGELNIDGLQLPVDDSASLGHIDRLATKRMTLLAGKEAPALAADSILLGGITLPSDKRMKMGSIGALEITALDAGKQQISMDSLAIRQLQAALLRGKRGNVDIPQPAIEADATGEKPKPADNPAPSENAAAPIQLRIGAFSVDRGSRVTLRDESVQPVFKSEMAIRRFTLAPLTIGTAEAGKLDLDITLDRQSTLQAKGSLTPDPAHLAADLSVALKELNLPALSPYIEQAMHFAIKTGQLDIDSKAKLAKGQLASENGIHIRRLQIDSGKDAPMVGGMTINTALEMIREDNGDINLDVPLNGPLDNIQAGLGDVINKALMTAMQKAALAYASQYLYPYGTIISVASTVAKAAMAPPRLSPIVFPPLQEKLDEKGLDYAGKITGLLKAKTKIRLQVCGVAAPAEAKTIDTQRPVPDDEHLLDLARARSRQVVETIAGQGIATDRLFACKPEIDRGEKAKGRVELLLE